MLFITKDKKNIITLFHESYRICLSHPRMYFPRDYCIWHLTSCSTQLFWEMHEDVLKLLLPSLIQSWAGRGLLTQTDTASNFVLCQCQGNGKIPQVLGNKECPCYNHINTYYVKSSFIYGSYFIGKELHFLLLINLI